MYIYVDNSHLINISRDSDSEISYQNALEEGDGGSTGVRFGLASCHCNPPTSIPGVSQLESMPPELQVEKPHQANYTSTCVTRVQDCRRLRLVFRDAGNMMPFFSAGLGGTVTWTVSSFHASGAPTYRRYWTVLVRITGVDRDQCDTCPTRAVTGQLLWRAATTETTDAAAQITYRHFFYVFLVLKGFSHWKQKVQNINDKSVWEAELNA